MMVQVSFYLFFLLEWNWNCIIFLELSSCICVPVLVLKNCEPELLYILAEFFNLCLNESWSPDFWKISSVVAILKNIWETSATESYRPASLLFLVNKFFEKLVNNMLVNHLEKFGFFLISNMVSGLLIQLRIFWQLYLIKLLGILIGLMLLKL